MGAGRERLGDYSFTNDARPFILIKIEDFHHDCIIIIVNGIVSERILKSADDGRASDRHRCPRCPGPLFFSIFLFSILSL